jgi:hypothetical protein
MSDSEEIVKSIAQEKQDKKVKK